jgi:hypothetical protein
MNANFDLNIDNYSKQELEEILGLPSNYDESIIDLKETKLRQNIINDGSISSDTKKNTLFFISNVKQKLATHLQGNGYVASEIKSLAKLYQHEFNLDKGLQNANLIDAGSTNIIKQPITPYGQSYPSEFYQGTLNPLSKRILKQNMNIDTRFRDNYYTTISSNFHVDLPIRLAQVVSMQLSALELPETFYVISKVFGNNFFVLRVDQESLIVTIPDGNYDSAGLQNYINHFLQGASIPADFQTIHFIADLPIPTTSSAGSGSGKMVVSGPQNFVLNFLTDSSGNDDRQTPLPLKLGWLMGFREGYYENNSNYVSEGIINLAGPRYIYLVVDDYNNSVNDGFYGAFNSSILNKNILARISLQGSVFNISSENNFNLITTPRQYFGPVDVQKLQIQLLDEYGRILNLNNMDYSFCLTFQTIYDL